MIRIILSLGLLLSYVGAESLKSVETRIINGSQVSSNDDTWRFIVSLKYRGNHYCAGSLIAPNWILTAAHCLTSDDGVPYPVQSGDTVGIGSYNLNQTTSYSIKRFIVHSSYDKDTHDNDIGLVEINDYISNIPVVKYDKSHPLSVNTQTKVAGWGNMNTSEDAPLSNSLREALTPLLDFNQCNSATSYNGQLTNNMLCAGYFVSTRDSCKGDSGGPLAIDNIQVGIVLGGAGCAQDGYPGVYTKVQNYKSWIESYVPPPSLWVPIMMDNIIVFVPNELNL